MGAGSLQANTVLAKSRPIVDGRLYSLRAISIATFLGSFLAGGFLVSHNFRECAQPHASPGFDLLLASFEVE
jgi:hypothetical protein